ncbi:MAG: RluA family pseudouridine synthase [Myxococcota bacterium]|nr:RluA family pseudouridine synthase [Myxococcota bacterium]
MFQEITVPMETEAIRLDRYAAENFDSISSRNQARKAIKREELLLNGVVAESSRFVRPGDVVCLKKRPPSNHKIFELEIPVHFEDEHLAVVEKPTGLVVNGNRYRTLQNCLRHNLAPTTEEDALELPRPCHRLDAPTGGLVVVAKTHRALVGMGHLFEHRKIKKRYRAIVVGRLEESGENLSPIEGRAAHTRYEVIGHNRALKSDWQTTVDLWPITGRTHQLRVHLSRLGHPILGDSLYATAGGPVLKGKGLFLRALALQFEHPVTGIPVNVALEEPEKFDTQRRREARRWHQFRGATPVPETSAPSDS